MTSKRKAGSHRGGTCTKVPRLDTIEHSGEEKTKVWIKIQYANPGVDPIYHEHGSDIDYSSSDELSESDQPYRDTPTTPFSTTSSRYPSERKTHLCPFEGCTKAFNRPARLQEHLRSHNNERIFRCDYEKCEKTFLRASHLNHHVKSAHTSIRDYVCPRSGCLKAFATGSRLRRHLAAHDGRDKYRCTEYPPCDETFRKHSTLHKHVMTVHLHKKPFPCPHIDPLTNQQCTQAFDTAGHLRSHEARIHTEDRFACTECAADNEDDSMQGDGGSKKISFSTYAQLQAHIKVEHPPTCPDCSMVCSSSRELRRHMEIAHGDLSLEERKVCACEVPGCGRSFTKKGNLSVHVRTVHEGEKRFACGETDLSSSKKVEGWNGEGCGKRYGSKLALEEHVRTAHLGLMNAKAERRARVGLKKKSQARIKAPVPSTMTMLTGQGYAEESGRSIFCFEDGCPHMFYRDYDLWVHMRSKHGLPEEDIQMLFTQRALQVQHESENVFGGIYGLDLDTVDPSFADRELYEQLLPQPSTEDDLKATQGQGSLFDETMHEIRSTNECLQGNDVTTMGQSSTFQNPGVSDFMIPMDEDMNLAH